MPNVWFLFCIFSGVNHIRIPFDERSSRVEFDGRLLRMNDSVLPAPQYKFVISVK